MQRVWADLAAAGFTLAAWGAAVLLLLAAAG